MHGDWGVERGETGLKELLIDWEKEREKEREIEREVSYPMAHDPIDSNVLLALLRKFRPQSCHLVLIANIAPIDAKCHAQGPNGLKKRWIRERETEKETEIQRETEIEMERETPNF